LNYGNLIIRSHYIEAPEYARDYRHRESSLNINTVCNKHTHNLRNWDLVHDVYEHDIVPRVLAFYHNKKWSSGKGGNTNYDTCLTPSFIKKLYHDHLKTNDLDIIDMFLSNPFWNSVHYQDSLVCKYGNRLSICNPPYSRLTFAYSKFISEMT
jgi:hypothetical protein